MGRIKTSAVKHTGKEIFDKHKDLFTADFAKNKEVLKEYYDLSSKKEMNVITGYITKLKKIEQRM